MTAPRAQSQTPARAVLPGYMAPGASSPSSWPLAGSPSDSGGRTVPLPQPRTAQPSWGGCGCDTRLIPEQEAPLKLNHAGSQGHGAGRAPHTTLAPHQHPWDPWLLLTPNGGLVLGAARGQAEAPRSQSAGAAGSADSAAAGPAFRWETGTEERGKKQHWQPGDCQGEFAELLSPNTRAARGTHPAQPLPCLPPRLQSPFPGLGTLRGHR